MAIIRGPVSETVTIALLMAIQVNESQTDDLGHIYSEGERLLCRIQLCRERQKQTQEYSKLAYSGDTAHDQKF